MKQIAGYRASSAMTDEVGDLIWSHVLRQLLVAAKLKRMDIEVRLEDERSMTPATAVLAWSTRTETQSSIIYRCAGYSTTSTESTYLRQQKLRSGS